jgi:hypothetical protein
MSPKVGSHSRISGERTAVTFILETKGRLLEIRRFPHDVTGNYLPSEGASGPLCC